MTLTATIFTVAIICSAIYDLIVVQLYGIQWTISKWFQTLVIKDPWLAFCAGALCGHFFMYMAPG